MEEIIIGIILIIAIIILSYIFSFNLKKIKKISEKECKDKLILDELQKLPSNVQTCKEILEELNNSQVEVVENPEYKSSLYAIYNNRITIGEVKNKIFEVQTIAHECIHSIQDKKIAIFNFVISNVYILYFYFILIGTIINKIFKLNNFIFEHTLFNIIIILLLGIFQYVVRSLLETEAILESKHLAEKYFEKKGIKEEIISKIIEEYSTTNSMGIKIINYMLISKNLIKAVIYILLTVLLKII